MSFCVDLWILTKPVGDARIRSYDVNGELPQNLTERRSGLISLNNSPQSFSSSPGIYGLWKRIVKAADDAFGVSDSSCCTESSGSSAFPDAVEVETPHKQSAVSFDFQHRLRASMLLEIHGDRE